MVVHAFPAAKLLALLMRQISKPIANFVKNEAQSSPVFRKYVCIPPAKLYNKCETKMKMWLLHLGQPVNITVLNEADSIDLGANLLGEAVIFLIAAGALLFEVNRSSKKEAAKEEARKRELREVQNDLKALLIHSQVQKDRIVRLTRKVEDLEQTVQDPTKPGPRSDESPPPTEPPELLPSSEDSLFRDEESKDDVNLLERWKVEVLKSVAFFIDRERKISMAIQTH
ncbi:unnamed protein product [Tenebrio molitor]|jgi:hypothetical protein|nr:unnamed protein product [Tenebrio molitor]